MVKCTGMVDFELPVKKPRMNASYSSVQKYRLAIVSLLAIIAVELNQIVL